MPAPTADENRRGRNVLTAPSNPSSSRKHKNALSAILHTKHSKGSLRFAVSCSSNMNRSMEAHELLRSSGFNVESFGTGNNVKLPGPSADKPNVYNFGTFTYAEIREDLTKKNKSLYYHNGLIPMLKRNIRVKERPQKFQLCTQEFDVIIALEERVYDQIIEHMHSRAKTTGNLVHLINVDIKDTQEEATLGSYFVRELCKRLEAASDLDNQIDDILVELDAENSDRNILHTVHFY